MRAFVPVLLSGAILASVSSCGSGSGTDPGPDESSSTAPEPDGTQQLFTVDQAGGTVQYRSPVQDVTVTLIIPPGALDGSTVITIEHSQDFREAPGLLVGAVFDFGPDGLVFNIPAELGITYSATLIGDLPEEDLRIHKANGSNWTPILGSVDTVNEIVSTVLDTFSTYGLKTIPAGGVVSGNPNASLAWLQTNVFGGVCSQCHTGAAAPMGLDWSLASATCANVGRASGEMPALLEIDSGSPAASYVIWKVQGMGSNGEAILGAQMPLSNPPLTANTVQNMWDWIADGTPGCEPPAAGGSDPGVGGNPDTWAAIQADILEVRCVLCHNNSPSAPMGLSWETDQYDSVVTSGRMSGEMPSMKIIEPGNSAASYMFWKINGQGPNGEAIVGSRMPASGPPYLTQAEIGRIGAWVDAGAGGDPSGGSGTSPSEIIPTWYGVQANILGQFCTLCHSGTNPPMGLSWEVDQYGAIVGNGRMSSERPAMAIVAPGDPGASYMFWKVSGQGPNGEAINGVPMPATGIPLDPALIDVIERWILDGAPLGDPTDADSGGSSGPSFPVGSWMHVWSESLQICTICHSRTPSSPRCGVDLDCPPKGVVLTADNYFDVVDGEIVEPFDLDRSDLWERVTEDDPDKRMPFGLDPLSSSQLSIIRDWIMDGAPFCPDNQVCP